MAGRMALALEAVGMTGRSFGGLADWKKGRAERDEAFNKLDELATGVPEQMGTLGTNWRDQQQGYDQQSAEVRGRKTGGMANAFFGTTDPFSADPSKGPATRGLRGILDETHGKTRQNIDTQLGDITKRIDDDRNFALKNYEDTKATLGPQFQQVLGHIDNGVVEMRGRTDSAISQARSDYESNIGLLVNDTALHVASTAFGMHQAANEAVSGLAATLTGDPTHDAPIKAQMSAIKAGAVAQATSAVQSENAKTMNFLAEKRTEAQNVYQSAVAAANSTFEGAIANANQARGSTVSAWGTALNQATDIVNRSIENGTATYANAAMAGAGILANLDAQSFNALAGAVMADTATAQALMEMSRADELQAITDSSAREATFNAMMSQVIATGANLTGSAAQARLNVFAPMATMTAAFTPLSEWAQYRFSAGLQQDQWDYQESYSDMWGWTNATGGLLGSQGIGGVASGLGQGIGSVTSAFR